MSEDSGGMGKSFFSKLIRGIMKLILAGFIVSAVSNINIPDLSLGNSTISGALFKAILQFVVPIAIIISALDDLGVKL